jgi:hypothetical protein
LKIARHGWRKGPILPAVLKRPFLLLLLAWLLALLLPREALASFTKPSPAWPSCTAQTVTLPLPGNTWPQASISLDLRDLCSNPRNGLFCTDDPVGNFDAIGDAPGLFLGDGIDDTARITGGVPQVHYWDWSHWWGAIAGGGTTDWWQTPSSDELALFFRPGSGGWRLASDTERVNTANSQFAAAMRTEMGNAQRQANAMAIVADGPVALASGVGFAGAAGDAALYGYVAASNSSWVHGGLLALGAYHLYNFATNSDYRGGTMSVDAGTGFSSVGYAASDLFSAGRSLLSQPFLNPSNYDWDPVFAPYRGGYTYTGVPVPGMPVYRGNVTRLGIPRSNPADWRATRDLWDQLGFGGILSDTNRAAIASGRTPIVDQSWISYFPEDTGLLGELIPMHHVQGLPITIPLPMSRHLDAHMPGGYRYNPGGPGSGLPIYP